MSERIGLLGGTFDPPHLGHLILAETARDSLKLDRILFLPVGDPPHKQGQAITAVPHRLAMIQLAIVDNPAFDIDYTDVRRPPPHTTDTLLRLLRDRYPAATFWLLVGSDSVRDLPTWREPAAIIGQSRLAMMLRPGAEVEWAGLETAVPGIRGAVDTLTGPAIAISSSLLRQRVREGRSLRYLVPPSVADYIQRTGLYQE